MPAHDRSKPKPYAAERQPGRRMPAATDPPIRSDTPPGA